MAVIDNLISYWSMDEASGSAIDAHSTNDLAENAAIAAGSGKVSGARDLEAGGGGNYFSIASNASLQTGDIDFSFACWINPESFSDSAVVAGKGNSEWYINFATGASNDEIRFVTRNTTVVTWGTPLSTATWYFVAGGYNTTNNDIWISIDGGTPVTNTENTGPTADGTQFVIGEYPPLAGVYFDGLIDEAGFWKRDIRSDLSWLYNSGSGRSYADIVAEAGGGVVGPLMGGHLTGGGILMNGRLVN
jgi:hypothetical protein